MYKLTATVKQGVSSDLDEASHTYDTLGEARKAAAQLGQSDVVANVMITTDDVPPRFVEWAVYQSAVVGTPGQTS